jgi:tRNA(fMet)-specific endonuclease VapC
MNYLFDTNILVHYLRKSTVANQIQTDYRPFAAGNAALLSVVSVGEIKALALRNHWGHTKIQQLLQLISLFVITDINATDILDSYAEIDTYSQGKLLGKPLAGSSRNMGKNDIWIAATAAVTGATILTTDLDFQHLHPVYCDVLYFEPKS